MAKRNVRYGVKIVFWIYLALLFVFVIMKFKGAVALWQGEFELAGQAGNNYNLIPFASIRNYWANRASFPSMMNLLSNTIPFIPFGILLPMSDSNKRFGSVLIAGLLFVLICEVVQYFTGFGIFDVDDIILNMASIVVGYLIWGLCHLIKKK